MWLAAEWNLCECLKSEWGEGKTGAVLSGMLNKVIFITLYSEPVRFNNAKMPWSPHLLIPQLHLLCSWKKAGKLFKPWPGQAPQGSGTDRRFRCGCGACFLCQVVHFTADCPGIAP